MMTFFSVFFILIGINAIMMFFSLTGIDQKTKKSDSTASKASESQIYPMDLASSEYKKAV
ncbi:hypothetical protein ACEZ3G_01020 [Maribacter algicola]|uniref:Uncharacterized protein n=1 Tax=Meishania litoralis TaxID=3434685 RepID=A0ACC7LFW7_9FLAO